MTFFGAVVKPGKAVPYVPPPEPCRLHLSQASLGDGNDKDRVTLRCKVAGEDEDGALGEEIIIAVFEHGKAESQTLDLIFDTYTEFTVKGAREVHIAGYFVPEEMEESMDEEDEDDDEDMMDQLYAYHGALGSGSEDEDEEEDDDSDDSQDEGEDGRRLIPASRVQIQELDDNGNPMEEDEEDEEEEEEEEEGSSSEDEDEDEEPEAAPAKAAGRKGSDGKGNAQSAAMEKKKGGKQEDKKGAKEAGNKRTAQEAPQDAKAGKKSKKDSGASGAGAGKEGEGSDMGLKKAGMVKEFENGFKIEQLAVGRGGGAVAKGGKRVTMKYVGKLASNGRVFDQNKSFKFRLGVGEVIKGWDRGIVGMRVGDKRRLTVPPQMAYGASGVRGAIPPNATLVFEVELVAVN